jgi:hypothetical protein
MPNKITEKDVKNMSNKERAAIIEAIKIIASYCDGARDLDGMGFNKLDTNTGKQLASLNTYSPSQICLTFSLVMKYRRQIPENLRNTLKKIEIKVKNGTYILLK